LRKFKQCEDSTTQVTSHHSLHKCKNSSGKRKLKRINMGEQDTYSKHGIIFLFIFYEIIMLDM
jgi:hypothetical protein